MGFFSTPVGSDVSVKSYSLLKLKLLTLRIESSVVLVINFGRSGDRTGFCCFKLLKYGSKKPQLLEPTNSAPHSPGPPVNRAPYLTNAPRLFVPLINQKQYRGSHKLSLLEFPRISEPFSTETKDMKETQEW